MEGGPGRCQIADRRQPQGAAAGELDQLLHACSADRVFSDQVGPLVTRQCRSEQLGGARRSVVHQQDGAQDNGAVARVGGDRVLRRDALGLPLRQRALRHEQARQGQALIVGAAGCAADVDYQFRGAGLRDVGHLRLHLVGRARADGGNADVSDTGRRDSSRHVNRGERLARQRHDVRVGSVAAENREGDLRSDGAAQRAHALPHAHVACRDVIDRADVIAGAQPGPGGGRVVACRQDAQVVLPRQLDAEIAGRQRRPRFGLLDLVGRQIGAVRIQRVDEAVHGAAHHLVDVDRLDVIARNEAHHVVEDLEVLIGVFPRHDRAEDAADDGEGDNRGGDGDNDNAGA